MRKSVSKQSNYFSTKTKLEYRQLHEQLAFLVLCHYRKALYTVYYTYNNINFQGALEIVKLMFRTQPTEKMACLTSCDVQKMTPLHCASMFDHPDIVEYLIIEGSEINPLDKERRSPLLLAASRSGWRTVHKLVN